MAGRTFKLNIFKQFGNVALLTVMLMVHSHTGSSSHDLELERSNLLESMRSYKPSTVSYPTPHSFVACYLQYIHFALIDVNNMYTNGNNVTNMFYVMCVYFPDDI